MGARARLLFLAGFLGVAACATEPVVLREVVVPGGQFEGVRGEAGLVVRTITEDAVGTTREVYGARCAVRSSLFEAELVTPSRLVVPNFGPQSPDLIVSCEADDLRGAARQSASTRWRYAPGYGYPSVGVYGGTGGRSGVAIGWGYGGWGYGGWGYGGRPAYPVSGYGDITVTLR